MTTSTVWTNTPEEESKARTVKDDEESIVSPAGQATLFAADYAPVPNNLIAISRAGVAEIGWNKAGSGGNGGGGGGGGTTGGGNTGGNTDKGTTEVSNLFTLTRKTVSSKTGSATLSVKLPGAESSMCWALPRSAKRRSPSATSSSTRRKAAPST